jgi:hypothetical protein
MHHGKEREDSSTKSEFLLSSPYKRNIKEKERKKIEREKK